MTTPNEATHDERKSAMNIVPARIQEQVNRVDRTRALVIGISAGVTALWSIYRLFWLVYTATTLSSVGYSPVSLVFPFVLWGAVGVAAGFVAVAFLLRYAKQP
jgi:predicted peptidase